MIDERYLLDTNAISEEGKKVPHPRAIKWLHNADRHRLWMSVVALGEARRWVEGKAEGRNKRALRAIMEKWEKWPAERVLPVTLEVALHWGDLSVRRQLLQGADGLIAATAVVHKMTLVTRNVKDFRMVPGLTIFNPWEDE